MFLGIALEEVPGKFFPRCNALGFWLCEVMLSTTAFSYRLIGIIPSSVLKHRAGIRIFFADLLVQMSK